MMLTDGILLLLLLFLGNCWRREKGMKRQNSRKEPKASLMNMRMLLISDAGSLKVQEMVHRVCLQA